MSKITPWPFSPGIIGRREDGPYVWHTAQWHGEEREFASYEGAERWLLRCKARQERDYAVSRAAARRVANSEQELVKSIRRAQQDNGFDFWGQS